MKNGNDPIRQENKKAMPKFILIFILSLVFGLILGFTLSFLKFESFGDALSAFGSFFSIRLAGWLLCACPIVELTIGLPLYFGAKKRLAAWDGEDEAVSDAIEQKLSVCIWISGMATVLGFFLAAGHFAGMAQGMFKQTGMETFHVFLGLGGFLVNLFVSVVFQQKLVDTTKKLNPEKHGSVYDPKFQKKWLDSCDEAERAIIGQCAMKAFRATSTACLVLWMVFVLGGMYFDWGFLPAMAVCAVWGVSQSVYSWWAIRLSKPSAPQAL